MQFAELIHSRRSVRAYDARPVETQKLKAILEAANRAPSAGNLQAFQIYTATEAGQRYQLAQAALSQEFIAQAPLVLVFCTHPARNQQRYRERGVELYTVQDATIACTFAMLAACDLGLGSVWVGAFDEDRVRKIIRAPRDQRPVAILPVGYPAEEPALRDRRSLEDLVTEL